MKVQTLGTENIVATTNLNCSKFHNNNFNKKSSTVNFRASKELTNGLVTTFNGLIKTKGFTDKKANEVLKFLTTMASTLAAAKVVSAQSKDNDKKQVLLVQKEQKQEKAPKAWSEEKISEETKIYQEKRFPAELILFFTKNQVPSSYAVKLKNYVPQREIVRLYKSGVPADEAKDFYKYVNPKNFSFYEQPSNDKQKIDISDSVVKFYENGITAEQAKPFLQEGCMRHCKIYDNYTGVYFVPTYVHRFNMDETYKMIKAGVTFDSIKELAKSRVHGTRWSEPSVKVDDLIRYAKFSPTDGMIKACGGSVEFLYGAIQKVANKEKLRACLSVDRVFNNNDKFNLYDEKCNFGDKGLQDVVMLCEALEAPADIKLIKPYLEAKNDKGQNKYSIEQVAQVLKKTKQA